MGTSKHSYEPVIGLEVHAQLLTKTKLFCGCATSFGDPPNTHTCPVCLGLPGALPVLNAEAVRMAARASLALHCTIQPRSVFARKNYFYPDLPKGYQISQYDLPLASRGWLEIGSSAPDAAGPDAKRRVGILRVHMEEDAGKNLHWLGTDSIVDLNRAGTPLIEIVGDPDLRSASEAGDYLRRLREILMFLGVNDGNLEQGSFRCDANVSVRRAGDRKFGTRAELKNINSFRFVEEAIDTEIRRQIALIESGQRVRQQTRGYNSEKKESYLLRDKENEAGYRYFPEPDLPPLVLDEAFLTAQREALPESPQQKRERYVGQLGLTHYAAGVITGHPLVAAFFEQACGLYPDPVKVANFVQGEFLRDVRTSGLAATFPVSAAQLTDLIRLVDDGAISGKQAKDVYAAMVGTLTPPAEIVKEKGMLVMSDEAMLEEIARALIKTNPKQAAAYRAGKTALLGFFIGQIMKQTGGSASPAVVNALLKRILDEGREEPTPAVEAAGSHSITGIRQKPSHPPSPAPPASGPASAPASVPAPVPVPASVPVPVPVPTSIPVPVPVPTSIPAPVPVPASIPAPVPVGAAQPAPSPATPVPGSDGDKPAISSMSAPAPQTIPFDVFATLDMRVGVVVSAARIPRKDKLFDLRIDTGDADGPRRIVSGLALSFSPEELVGKRVVVLCNLEARAFSKDLVSHGMILASGPSDALALVTVSRDVPPGTRVK